MKVLVIGFGSIGSRHAQNLKDLGLEVAVVSRRIINIEYPLYNSIEKSVNDFKPSVVFICTETSKHIEDLDRVLDTGYDGKVIIEKPFYYKELSKDRYRGRDIFISYNLRFLDIIQKVKLELEGEKVLSALFYCGQDLRSWRPDRDYRETYSAKKELGGGVHWDLSHEIDLGQFLLGKINKMTIEKDKISDLEINSVDQVSILGSFGDVSQTLIQLNYIDKIHNRFFLINTLNKTISADLYKQKLIINDQVFNFENKRNSSYFELAKKIKNREWETFSTIEDSLDMIQYLSV